MISAFHENSTYVSYKITIRFLNVSSLKFDPNPVGLSEYEYLNI